MLNYKRFTFNYRHSVFYCISKYYLRCPAHVRHDHHAVKGRTHWNGVQDAGHTNIETTQIYARITNSKIGSDMQGLDKKFVGIEKIYKEVAM